jgi:hypothetical protein
MKKPCWWMACVLVLAAVPRSVCQADLIVSVGPESTAVAGDTVTFDGSATGGVGTLNIQWDFNYDGSTFIADPSAAGTFTPSHQFINPGNYEVALEVTDSQGDSGIGTTIVTVATAGPITLSIAPVAAAVAGEAVRFAATEVGGAAPLQIQWDFNYDGTTFHPDPAADGSLTPTHTFINPGTYEVEVRVTDADGITAAFPTRVAVAQTPEPSSLVLLLAGGTLTICSCHKIRGRRPRP